MVIALAGGICSGKSVVSDILKSRGETVVSTDKINAELLEDPSYLIELARLFPTVFVGGTVDKKALRNIIFNDKNERVRLNSLAHPAILARMQKYAQNKRGRVFVEIPLLMESGAEKYFDKIWFVSADDDIRIARLTERDGISRDSAEKILLAQSGEARAKKIADTVIENNGTLSELENKVSGYINSL